MTEKILQDCKELYNQFFHILENMYTIGYREAIVKMFNLVNGSVHVDFYRANSISLDGYVGHKEFSQVISYDDVTEEFNKLADDILYSYYKEEKGTLSIEDFTKAIKTEEYA